MAKRSWVISVLSTDYDLHEYREVVIKQLRDKEVVVSAFELPDFPVEPDIHSHDSCKKALDRVDIALLIIDKRYGGIYFNDKNGSHSITEVEYLTMVKSGRPCFVFVSKQTWDERHLYKESFKAWVKKRKYTEEQKKTDVAKTEFDKKYKCSYVDSVKTIEFVEEIQKSYETFSVSNWIEQYASVQDLLSRVEGKLKGLSRFLLERIVREQKKKLENRHTSTGLSLSLGDVFSRGYYLEPSFEQESGTLLTGNSLDEMINNTLLDGTSILVYGEAGYGKTTILAKSYLTHANSFLEHDSYNIPLYLWLKKKTCDYHFDFRTYIDESFIDDCGIDAYPFMDITNIRPYFYFDGFDEIAEKMTPDEVEKISRANIFNYPILLTCRQQYTFRYINTSEFSDKFGVRIKVNTWDTDMAVTYIDNFCSVNKKSKEFASALHQSLVENQSLRDILNSPLLITMFLWIVEQNRMRIPEAIHTKVELFKTWINELAKRELTRLGQSVTMTPNLVTLWSYAAWEVYYNKLNSNKSRFSTLIPVLKQKITEIPDFYSIAHFEVLFESSGDDEIFGTFHEQFLEFLVANTIYIACNNASYPYPEFLRYVIRPEINRYFRAIWYECTPIDQKHIVTNLYNQYALNLGDDSFGAVSKRVHAMYHIGRFNIPERQNYMKLAFNSESHISVRLSLFFGSIKMGQLNDEQNFYELLTTDENYNDANRGYHLAYYSDAIMDDTLPFQDNIQATWTGSLKAFLHHFRSEEEGHYFLRRIDLVTIKHFIEARNKVEPLTQEIINEMEHLICTSRFSKKHPEFQSKIEVAFNDLKETFEKKRLKNVFA